MAPRYPVAEAGSPVWCGAVVVLTLPWIWPFSTGPWPAAQQTILTLACAGVLLLALAGRRLALAQAVAASWLVAAGLSSVMGLVQYFGLSPGLQPWVNATALGEAFGNLRQRNQFASLTNLGLAVLIWSPFSRWPASGASLQQDPGHPLPPGAWLCALLLPMANAASASRAGLLELGVVSVLALVWSRGGNPRVNRVLLVAVAAYVAAAMALPLLLGMNPMQNGIGGRLRAEGLACGSRWTLWANVLQLIIQMPWSGWGWGELDFAHFMAEYSGPRFCEILDNAHNLPLHLAVELGLPVAIGVCALSLYLMWRGEPWRAQTTSHRMAWTAVALILMHSLVEYPLWYGPFQLALGTALWMLFPAGASATQDMAEGQSALPTAWRLPTAVIAVVALSAATFAAWDYWRVSQIYAAPESRASAYMSNTLEKIRGSWLFSNQVRFAELATTDVTAGNAARIYALSGDLLHFSPESRVVEKRIESALLLGHDAVAEQLIARFKAAFPKEYAKWAGLRLFARPEDTPAGSTSP